MTNQRKHATQMTDRERALVSNYVHSIGHWDGLNNPHLRERKVKWNLTDAEIIEAIKSGEVIEAHANNAPDIRVVLRRTIGMRDVCVCVSANQRVVTAWINNTNDTHGTLRLADYQWHVDLANVFKGVN